MIVVWLRRARGVAAGIAICSLSACVEIPVRTTSAVSNSVITADLVGAPSGLLVGDSGLRVDFGRTQDSTLASVTRILGDPPNSVADDQGCTAGPLTRATWDGQLTLFFQNGDFRGWQTDNASFMTSVGVRVGADRAQLEAAGATFRSTAAGEQVSLSRILGLLNAEARIAVLWSGTVCATG